MKSFLGTHLFIASLALAVAMLLVGTAWYTHHTQRAFELDIENKIDAQINTIQTLAELTDNNGADALTERIIVDCPKRQEFESFLVRLNALPQKDLLLAQQLFDSCGAFYAERKALMVSRLEREYEIFVSYTELLKTLRDLTTEERTLFGWSEVIELEKNRSSLLNDQVTLQSKVITLLLSRGAQMYKEVDVLLREADEVSQSLGVLDKQVEEKRDALIE